MMIRSTRRASFQTLLACALIASAAAASPGQERQAPPPRAPMTISPQAAAQIQALVEDKAARTATQNRIDSSLLYRQKMARGQLAGGLASLRAGTESPSDGRETVDVTARDGLSLVPDVRRLGAEVLFADALMLRLKVDLDALEAIADLPGVVFVGRPQLPYTQSVAPRLAGALRSAQPRAVADVTSQGDAAHKAATARAAYGVNGAGIKIGVISSGVDGLADAQAAGALGPVTVLPGQAGEGNEGTAMLEIVHDLAPGAQLYYATAFPSATQFAANIRALAAAGCQIIVDDVGYTNETPFQDGQTASVVSTGNAGVIAQAVKDVAAAGVLYFSSSANSGGVDYGTSGTWEGDFKNSGFTFNGGRGRTGIAHQFGVYAGLPFPANYLNSPGSFVALFWADPLGGSRNDYDLYLLDGLTGAVKDASTNTQNGTQDPFEVVSKGIAAGDEIVVVKYSGSDRYLHVDTGRGVLYFATAGSTHGHAATSAPTSFGVAAAPAHEADASRPGCIAPLGPYPNPFTISTRVECFSSDGNRRIFFNGDGSPITANNFLEATNGGRVLLKPDLTAADGVAVSGAGYDATKPLNNVKAPFFGTSAAAPHAAAIAALVWSRNLAQTATAVKTALVTGALDIMGAGRDRSSGVGIIMADAAVAAVVPGPRITLERSSVFLSAVSTGAAFAASTAPQTVRLNQSGSGSVSWTAVSTTPWLVVSPASGIGPAVVTIAPQFTAGLAATQTGTINFTFTGAANLVNPITATLTVAPATAAAAPPFGVLDTPIGDSTPLAGSIAITGWTLDNIGVQRVEIWRDLQAGETTPPFASTPSDPRHGKIFVANATFVDGARPDVEGLYPTTPFNYRAGWGYLLLTWGLWNQGNGTYNLYAFAFDQENNLGTIGKKTVVVSNHTATKPFGSIDTPGIGGNASGPLFAWGLTPKVNGAATCRIPANGVQVSIDSGPLQPVVYGDVRTDIAGAFAGFSNSAAAGGHFIFDWSALAPGPHTIGLLVTDDCNRADGVGSRFFNVAAGSSLTTADAEFRLKAETGPDAQFRLKAETTEFEVGRGPVAISPVVSAFRRNPADEEVSAFERKSVEEEATAPILVSRGYGELPEAITPDQAGHRTIEIKQGERIEVRLPHGYETAHQLAGAQPRPLPAGSTWDAASGTFYWQPAPAFLGRYRIVFSNGRARINLDVIVTPQQ
jgi:hypothetical protein